MANRRNRSQQAASGWLVSAGIGLLAVLVVAALYVSNRSGTGDGDHRHSEAAAAVPHLHEGPVTFPHIHGMGFTPDGTSLFVAAHDGLRQYVGGEWLLPDIPRHDYMGYTPVDSGFYSSGHPAPNTGYRNPLGLVRSTDDGATLNQLAFQEESDFHLMGAGYSSHALYVVAPAPNSRLGAGLHSSLDDGQTWQARRATGLAGKPVQLTVHPTDPQVLAFAATNGLYLSRDSGDSFTPVGEAAPVTMAVFDANGTLYFGYQALLRYDRTTGALSEGAAPPLSVQEGLSYLAVNPTDPLELVVATSALKLFRSTDGGSSWQDITP